jgi:hypothetical protein
MEDENMRYGAAATHQGHLDHLIGPRSRPMGLGNGITGTALALAMTMACVGRAGAAPHDQGGGAPFGVARATHASLASVDVRADATPMVMRVATADGGGGGGGGALTINATFDSSITSDPNAAAIEAMINEAVGVYESLFDDPIVVSIRFRYATTYANGTTPLSSGLLAASETGIYVLAWNSYMAALTADATTANDDTANRTLPGTALTPHLYPSSADGRAVGLGTPPVMFADGSVGQGGAYDGIITINAAHPFSLTRPPAAGVYDARRSVEHEIDEVLGLGSSIDKWSDLRPQDLFSWSATGVRNLTSSGSRYFSIDGGATDIVGFNQDPNGDFGDWLSASCPQATPYAQNAFSCPDQVSDVTRTSPEGIGLDVIGYDLIIAPTTTTTPTTTSTTTTTVPACPTGQVACCPVGQPGCGVCGTDCGNGGCCPATHPVCDNADGLCIACGPGQVECCPAGQPGCGACGTDCGNGGCCPASNPICDNANVLCLAQASGPECGPGQVPCTDAALGFANVACCSQPTTNKQCAAACDPIVAACQASCTTDAHPKKCRKRCRAAIVGHCRRSRPRACS